MVSEKISVGIIECGHGDPKRIRVFSQLKEVSVSADADENRCALSIRLFAKSKATPTDRIS
jgi:hypothetical protein